MQAGFQSSEGTAFGQGTISACAEPKERPLLPSNNSGYDTAEAPRRTQRKW